MPALGTSFTKWRAESLGLDYQKAFARICAMGFGVVRLSASWRELAQFGYAHLDWLVNHAALVGQRIVLTVGMKALGWPEFYLPEGLDPTDAAVQLQAIAHVEAVPPPVGEQPAGGARPNQNQALHRSRP